MQKIFSCDINLFKVDILKCRPCHCSATASPVGADLGSSCYGTVERCTTWGAVCAQAVRLQLPIARVIRAREGMRDSAAGAVAVEAAVHAHAPGDRPTDGVPCTVTLAAQLWRPDIPECAETARVALCKTATVRKVWIMGPQEIGRGTPGPVNRSMPTAPTLWGMLPWIWLLPTSMIFRPAKAFGLLLFCSLHHMTAAQAPLASLHPTH